MVDVEKFWRDGFLVIPKVLDPALVQRWREAALERENKRADLLTDPVLQEVVLNETLIGIARQILDCERLVYFCDSTAAIGRVGWVFHKDNSDRIDASAPDWTTDRYPLIRFGIYTKPHGGDEPGAIEFRRGSHLVADYTTGERCAAATQPGDLVVWNARTTHSANQRISKVFGWSPSPDMNTLTFRVLRRSGAEHWLMKGERTTRVAIFTMFAKEHPLLHRHMSYLKTRSYPWEMWKASHWTPEVRALARQRGLDLLDPTGLRWDGSPVSDVWVPVPHVLPPWQPMGQAS
jgi:hypothetical protein